jgi:hypothetical protein
LAIAANGKSEAARGEPIAHRHRADDTYQRARNHVAGVVGQQ